jgi:hypothetical protein
VSIPNSGFGCTSDGKRNQPIKGDERLGIRDDMRKFAAFISGLLGYTVTFKKNDDVPHKTTGSRSLKRPIYDQDSLFTVHNHDFMNDQRFIAAYDRGLKSCDPKHILIRGGKKHQIHWRVHVVLWAASQVLDLDGDYVECGVDRGVLSSAIMHWLDWNSLHKRFFLFDTFCGIDPVHLNEAEKKSGRFEFSERTYFDCFENVKRNFSTFKNVHLIKGSVPASLEQADIKKVSYLSIDMNNAKPEIEAANYFWDKLVSGAIVVLDDYAYVGYDSQKHAFDQFAKTKNISILSLPTGQGLIIKK